MKRWILVLMFAIIGVAASAQQNLVFKATSYAIANVNTYSSKYIWSDWYNCNIKIVFDLHNDVIYIYSNEPQKYNVITQPESFTDNSGGSQMVYKVIGQDGDRGTLRLRIERNGNSQLYVDFNNVAWVYNVIRI